ncbi:MAG TPA: 3'-5' exonuclease [Ktedonobacterales bacterium]|jgi:superfamily I DNA/RNA helicase
MSSYVNHEVRMLDREIIRRRARMLNVGHHDAIYAWLRRYSGYDNDEIATVVTHQEPEQPETPGVPEHTTETLLDCLPHAGDGKKTYGCIPSRELIVLGFTATQAERIRGAPDSTQLTRYGISSTLDDAIVDLWDRYSPQAQALPVANVPVPLPIPLASDDDVITITAPGQYEAMVDMGLDRYLALLTEEQRDLAEMAQTGLLVVKGSAGSGKTAIATHRVRFLADRLMRQPALLASARRKVLYLCYNRTLAQTVKQMLATLYGHQPPDCIEVSTIGQWANDYLQRKGVLPASSASIASSRYADVKRDMLGRIRRCLRDKAGAYQTQGLTPQFLCRELSEVIIGRGLECRDDYIKANRTGQGTRLTEKMRHLIWDLYAEWRSSLIRERATDINLVPWHALRQVTEDGAFQPYVAVIVDEAQDFTPVRLRLASQLGGNQLDRLTLFADAAQVIYTSGFRWNLAELNPRGRQVRTINHNFRNTHEIHALAAALLVADEEPQDPDTYVTAQPPQTHGPLPELLTCRNSEAEVDEVCKRIRARIEHGTPLQQVAVLVGTRQAVTRYVQALRARNITAKSPDATGRISITDPAVKVLTMHSAKGLDFPVVFLADLTRTGIPGPRADQDADGDSVLPGGLQRRLLYTAIARAGRSLTLSTIEGSEHPLLAELPADLCARANGAAQWAVAR